MQISHIRIEIYPFGVFLEKRIAEAEAQFALNLMLLPSMYAIVSEYILYIYT